MNADKLPRLSKVVGTIVILSVVGLWVWSQFQSEPLDMIWQMAVLVLLLASGYAVFGPKAMSEAVDDAKQIKGEGDQTADEASE